MESIPRLLESCCSRSPHLQRCHCRGRLRPNDVRDRDKPRDDAVQRHKHERGACG